MRAVLIILVLLLSAVVLWMAQTPQSGEVAAGAEQARDATAEPRRAAPAGDRQPEAPPDVSRTPAAAPAVIEGIVRDDAERGVADARVRVFLGAERPATSARTDTEGRFRIELPAATATQPASLETYHPQYQSSRTPDVAWGRRDVTLRLVPHRGLRLFVTRARDGQPVERFAVFANWTLPENGEVREWPRGEATLRGLGTYVDARFLVLPEDPALATPGPIAVGDSGRADVGVIRVELPDKVSRALVFDGLPPREMHQVRVELSRAILGWPATADAQTLAPEGLSQMRSTDEAGRSSILGSHGPQGLRLASAVVPGDGRLELRAPAGDDHYLRVHGPCCDVFLSPVRWRPGLPPLRVTLEKGTRVVATVALSEALRKRLPQEADPNLALQDSPFRREFAIPGRPLRDDRPRVHLTRADRPDARVPALEPGCVTIDHAGKAVLPHVPPGQWTAWLTTGMLARKTRLLPTITVVQGQADIEVDLQPEAK